MLAQRAPVPSSSDSCALMAMPPSAAVQVRPVRGKRARLPLSAASASSTQLRQDVLPEAVDELALIAAYLV